MALCLAKISFQVLNKEKKYTQSFEMTPSVTNNYLILLKGLFGNITQIPYRHNNTNLLYVSAVWMCLL